MDPGYEIRPTGDSKGLGFFATRAFKEHDIILEEKPIVSVQFSWNETYDYLACHHCLRPLETTEENVRRLTGDNSIVLPYPELCPTNKLNHTSCDDCGVQFCCEECKRLALLQYHELLCLRKRPGVSLLNDTWKSIHYPPETTSIMLLARIIATIEQSPDKNQTRATFLQFNHSLSGRDEEILYKLLGKGNLHLLQETLPQALPASSYTQDLLTEDGMKQLFILVGRNGQGVGTSVYSEWVKRAQALTLPPPQKTALNQFIDSVYDAMDKHVGTFLNCEGSGLYKTQRCVNHNCCPNATVTFPHSDHTLVLVAQRDIAAGEEICTSYLDDCLLASSRHTRNNILRDCYLFECSCEKCMEQAGDLDETSEEDDDDDEDDDNDCRDTKGDGDFDMNVDT